MHLAVVSPYPPDVTGISQYGYFLSRALARSGFFQKVTLLAQGQPSDREQSEGILQVERAWQADQLDTGWKILRRLQALQPDVVWYNLGVSVFGRSPWANLSGLLSPALVRMSGFPIVATLHELIEQCDLQALDAPGGVLASMGAQAVTRLCTQVDVVCIALRRQEDWLRQRLPSLNLLHIPHGSYDHPELLDEPAGNELLIFTSYAPFKGLELLLEAFSDLQQRYPDLRLTVAGAEHPRFPGYLEQVRRSFGERPSVRWLGCVPEASVREIFRMATIVVLPYTATTGSSSVLLRAATWGRAVVSSDLPELCAAAEEARLHPVFFRSGSRAGMVDAIDSLLAGPARRKDQVMHNFKAASHLSLEESCNAYLRAFDLALALRSSSQRIDFPIHSQEPL